ncbi:MAG: preprotein translocase subunit SecE [Gammaproteobacteria bacterium]|nr:preprotein translocase subunit SecE [Gammaproteobacteria bacterium]
MSATPTTQNSRFDIVKWIFVLALVIAGIVGNSAYSDQSLLYRTLALVAMAGVALFVALQTTKGRGYALSFKEARKEIRKVVWPTRQETTQTTLIVVVVVFIMALVLWGLDSFLSWAVSSIIG